MSNQQTTFYYKLFDAILETNTTDTTVWTNEEKYSLDVILNSSSYVVNLSFIDSNIRFVLFQGSGQYVITMVSSGQTVVFNVHDLFVFTPLPEFMANLTSLTISSPDAVNTTVSIRAFGEYLIPNTDVISFTPIAGSYTGSQTVTLTSTLTGSTVRYTVDGTTPTRTNGTLYTGSITVAATETIKAISYMDGYALSSVASALFTIA